MESLPTSESPRGPSSNWKSFLAWFANNPAIGAVSFVVSIVSLCLTLYYGVLSTKTRQLALYVNPVRTTIVRSGQSSELNVLYHGERVTSDVSAIQVAFWNNGRESIRPENVLSKLQLSTGSRAPILEAKLTKVARSISGLAIDDRAKAEGVITLNWKILEPGDGGVIQVLYVGDAKTKIDAHAVIEGQSLIPVARPSDESGQPIRPRSPRDRFFGLFAAIAMALASGVLLSFATEKVTPFLFHRRSFAKVFTVLIACLTVGGIALMCYQLFEEFNAPYPPFGV